MLKSVRKIICTGVTMSSRARDAVRRLHTDPICAYWHLPPDLRLTQLCDSGLGKYKFRIVVGAVYVWVYVYGEPSVIMHRQWEGIDTLWDVGIFERKSRNKSFIFLKLRHYDFIRVQTHEVSIETHTHAPNGLCYTTKSMKGVCVSLSSPEDISEARQRRLP